MHNSKTSLATPMTAIIPYKAVLHPEGDGWISGGEVVWAMVKEIAKIHGKMGDN